MSFMKKNVNMALLLVIVMMVLSFTGITTYYQSTYRNLSQSYGAKILEIQQLSQVLNVRGSELNKTYSELQIRVADKTRFDKLYADLTNEKERLDADLAATRATLRNVQDELSTKELKLEEAYDKISDLQQKVNTYESQIDSLEQQITNLKAICGAPCQ